MKLLLSALQSAQETSQKKSVMTDVIKSIPNKSSLFQMIQWKDDQLCCILITTFMRPTNLAIIND